jgi:hypothetical protein
LWVQDAREGSISAMAKYDDELDWEKLKQGRLEEGNHDELGLTGSGRGARQSPVYLRLSVRPARQLGHLADKRPEPLDALELRDSFCARLPAETAEAQPNAARELRPVCASASIRSACGHRTHRFAGRAGAGAA